MNINKQAVISALKELARLSIIALVTTLITWLTTIHQSIDQTSVWSFLIFAALKLADRYAYKANGVNVTKI